MRRLRRTAALRTLVRETRISPQSFIYPLFVCPGEGIRREVSSMPGVFNLSVDEAIKEARLAHSLGISGVILFGLPSAKDEQASGAWAKNGIVQQSIRALKKEVPELLVVADVCLCEYMSHGHCGVVRSGSSAKGSAEAPEAVPAGGAMGKDRRASLPGVQAERRKAGMARFLDDRDRRAAPAERYPKVAAAETLSRAIKDKDGRKAIIQSRPHKAVPSPPPALAAKPEVRMEPAPRLVASASASDYEIDNDATLKILARTAVSVAEAGADIIAPSDMMDGRVAAIRKAMDGAGHQHLPILSYAAKFASGFYGPFREAADSAPQFGDRHTYQMDGANLRQAMREIELDIEEGADMIMVKPALPYLDVIAAARDRFNLPLAAYQVSGEYAMIQAAARNHWIDGDRVMMESLISIRRAGADMIITYFAKEASRMLG